MDGRKKTADWTEEVKMVFPVWDMNVLDISDGEEIVSVDAQSVGLDEQTKELQENSSFRQC